MGSALATGATAGHAIAADQGGGASTGSPSSGMEEIVVTAQKRTEDIKEVPISISVLSGGALAEQHIQDYQDITRSVPGLSFGAGSSVSGSIVGPGTTNIEIRGVSSSSGSATVGLYLDDTSITQSNLYVGAVQPKFVDFDRVEVLRGPQGTLFGASSMGGTIRLISHQPQFNTLSADLKSDLSGTDHAGVNYEETGIVNIPIIDDKLAVRVALQLGGNSGWIDHLPYPLDPREVGAETSGTIAKTGTNTEIWGLLRFTAKYQPTYDLTITAAALGQQDHTADTPVFYPQLGLFKQNKSVNEPSTDSLFIPSVTIVKDFDAFSVTSVTGYFKRRFSFQSDGTFFNSNVIGTVFLDPLYPEHQAENDALIATLPSPVHRTDRTYQGSEEIRATSKSAELFGNPLSWIAGLYLEYQRQARDDFEPAPGLQATFQKIYGFSINDSLIGPGAMPGVTYANDLAYSDNQWLDQIQYAAFGQVEYNILPELKVAAGLRYLYATQNYYRNSGGIFDFGNVNPFFARKNDYAITPKFSVTYDLTDATSLYATIAKGFRLGGPTGPIASSVCQNDLNAIGVSTPPTGYGPDKLWSYEGGVKARLLDNRLSIDADAYYIDWSNIQQTVGLPTCGASVTFNFGAAESYGTEIEVEGRVTDGLTLRAGGGITRAVITESPNALTAAPGQAVLNAPKWSLAVGADYEFKIDDSLNGFARTDYDYVGSSHGAFNESDPAFQQPGYGVLNGSVGIDSGTYQVFVYVKNLLNNNKIIQRPSINFIEEAYTLKPLTVGINTSVHF